jgi:hypothetical protein
MSQLAATIYITHGNNKSWNIYKQNQLLRNFATSRQKVILKNTNISECSDSKTSIQKSRRAKPLGLLNRFNRTPLSTTRGPPVVRNWVKLCMDLHKNAAVTDCTIKMYKTDTSYVRSNRDSHYDRKTSATNPFMLQFVKFTSGITVSSLITWITQTAWHIKCRQDLYYLLVHRQGINVFLPAKMNHRCLIKVLVEDPHRCS